MFIIRCHYVATEVNKNFAGQVTDYYHGKGWSNICGENRFPSDGEVREYGYKTLSGALKGLKAHQELAARETSCGHWTVTADLLGECTGGWRVWPTT